MGLTVRGKDADKFWFSFFHELAHIILGHIGKPEGTTDEDEDEANLYATNALIPEYYYDQILSIVEQRKINKTDIISFADTIGVAPGIVLGRLQKEGYVDYSYFHDLKIHYSIS